MGLRQSDVGFPRICAHGEPALEPSTQPMLSVLGTNGFSILSAICFPVLAGGEEHWGPLGTRGLLT